MSVTQASAFPPAASTSSAASYTVPGSLGCGLSVLATIAMLAPSRAARSAIALPMPRLAPVMKRVLPRRLMVRQSSAAAAAVQFGGEAALLLGQEVLTQHARDGRDIAAERIHVL